MIDYQEEIITMDKINLNPELLDAIRILKKNALDNGEDLRNRDIAEKLRIAEQSLSTYISGKVRISKPFIQKFKEVYGIDLLKNTVDNLRVLTNPTDKPNAPIPYYDKPMAASGGVQIYNDLNNSPT